MITSFSNESSRIFLCYRRNGVMVARAFYDALGYIPDLQYGKVWFSVDHPEGNYELDLKWLLSEAEYAVLFLEEGFTTGFLKPDGTTNDRADENGCVTVLEILEIERQRQRRENFKVLCVNYHGYRLSLEELDDLRKVFSNAGILRDDSVTFYARLNQSDYQEQYSLADFIRLRFNHLVLGASRTDANDLLSDAFEKMYIRSAEKLKTVSSEKFGQDGLQPALLAPIIAEDHLSPYDNLYHAVDDILCEFRPGAPILITARGGQGKSTQLIYLWQRLLEHKDAAGRHDCVCLLFDLSRLLYVISDEIRENKKGFLPILLQSTGLDPSEADIIIREMQRTPAASERRFFLIFDGLDEVNEDAAILKELGKLSSVENSYMNMQVIFAGRMAVQSTLTRNVFNLKLDDLNWRGEQAKQWLVDNGMSELAANALIYDEIAKSPMMVMMLCKIKMAVSSRVIQRRLFGHNECDYVSRAEVLWNYTEVLLNKYLTSSQFSKEDKDFAIRFMHELLPLAAYKYYFDKNKMDAAEHSLKKVWKDGLYDRCRALLDGPFSGMIDRNGHFSHRLLRDYFAMLYIGHLMEKLYETDDISDSEYEAITDRRFWDNKEYTDLLISIVPGVLGFTEGRYELATENDLTEFIQDSMDEPDVYNGKRYQCLRMLQAFYPRWTAEFYLSHHPACKAKEDEQLTPAQQEIRKFVQKMLRYSYEYFEDIAATITDDEKRRLPPHNVSLICCILSLSYRKGWLLMKSNVGSKIEGLEPDLNKSLFYAFQAEKMLAYDPTLIDCYGYIVKAFNAAYEELANGLRKNGNGYVLRPFDLYLNEEILSGSGLSLSQQETEQLIRAKPGDMLSADAVKRRMLVIRKLADQWLDQAIRKECTPSMNLKALILEMEQEELPASERSFLASFKLYHKASQSGHAVSDYSALKAAQLLAERRVGLDCCNAVCEPGDACAENTVKEAMMLFEIATMYGQNWKYVAMYRGKLKLNYRFYEGKKLTEEEAVAEAYHDFEMAYKAWPVVPVILALAEAGFRLFGFCPAMEKQINANVTDVLMTFLKKFTQYKNMVMAEKHSDSWTPSVCVFYETCEQVYSITGTNQAAIAALQLSELAAQCVQMTRACMDEIKEWEKTRR